jgi:Spy/CpxP family protein refolding chaperone
MRGWVIPAVLGSALFVGCSGAASISADPGGAAAAQEQSQADDPGQPGEQLRQRFHDALMRLNLRPDQKTEVDKLEADLAAVQSSGKAARTALRAAVADQVQRGAIDKTALAPQVDAVVASADQIAASHRAALVHLHDLLDRDQRNQLVDTIESGFRDAASKHGWHGGHHGKGLRAMADDLGLSDQQRQQIGSAIRAQLAHDGGHHGEFREGIEHMHRLLEAFREDQFVPESAGPSLFSKEKVASRIDRMLTIVQIATPILTPDQRTLAAAKIRDGKWKQ